MIHNTVTVKHKHDRSQFMKVMHKATYNEIRLCRVLPNSLLLVGRCTLTAMWPQSQIFPSFIVLRLSTTFPLLPLL